MSDKKKFTDYYQNPEFKKKHLAYVMTKVDCICGGSYMRSNKTNHYSTQKHEMYLLLQQAKKDVKKSNKLIKLLKAI